MAESVIQVNSGSGPKIHTWNRTIGANSVEDQFLLPGEYPVASYILLFPSVSLATANDHIAAWEAGTTNVVRVRRIHIEQSANASTAAATSISLLRTTTAGSGGTAVTPSKHDTADGAYSGLARYLGTKGTESTELTRAAMVWRQAVAVAQAQFDDVWEWVQLPGQKPFIIPAGTANGMCLKSTSAVAGATVHITVELLETSFL